MRNLTFVILLTGVTSAISGRIIQTPFSFIVIYALMHAILLFS